MKMNLHAHFLNTFMDKHPWDSSVKTKLRAIFKDHSSVRVNVEAYPDNKQVELSWQNSLPDSAKLLSNLIEAVVFGDAHDTSIKNACKHDKAVEDILEYALIKEEVTAVLEQLQKEKESSAAAERPRAR